MTRRTKQPPELPSYGELAAGQVIRPAPGWPRMLDADARPTGNGLVLLTFTDGTWNAARLRSEDYTWRVRKVCEETYRLHYGTRPPQGRCADG